MCLWFDWLAYAAGSEGNSSEDVEDCSSRAAVSEAGTARTDTGRDKLQCPSDLAESTGDAAVVCPSGEALNAAVTGHVHSSLSRSCSMPLMCSKPPDVTLIDRKSIESELQHLSTYAKLRQFASSPLENSKNGRIAKSPYMSPLLASDEVLQQLCPVHLIVRFASFNFLLFCCSSYFPFFVIHFWFDVHCTLDVN